MMETESTTSEMLGEKYQVKKRNETESSTYLEFVISKKKKCVY